MNTQTSTPPTGSSTTPGVTVDPKPKVSTRRQNQLDWIADHVQMIRGLERPTQQQKALMELHSIPSDKRTPDQERAYKTLEKAVLTERRADIARANADNMFNKKRDLERVARNHQMFQSAGLLILAGLVDTKTGMPFEDPALLLGKLMQINQVNWSADQLQEMQTLGMQIMAESEERQRKAGNRGHS